MTMHYLDYAATTPVPRAVAKAMAEALTESFGNPSSQYSLGRQARDRLERDRRVIAGALGCKPEQLFFTSCGTEGDNWAIRAALHQNRRVGRHIVTTAVEHSAVLQCLKDGAVLHGGRSEEHTSELQSRFDLVCRLLLEKKNKTCHQSPYRKAKSI